MDALGLLNLRWEDNYLPFGALMAHHLLPIRGPSPRKIRTPIKRHSYERTRPVRMEVIPDC